MGGHARASRALLALLALPWFLALAPAQAADEPRAFFTVQPAVGRTGAAFLADASLSSPSPGERIESYHWRWANGSFEPGNATSSHVFRQAGVFEVALRIRDTAGRESLALQTVYVEGARPLAYFTARTEERDGATVVTVDATFSQPSAGARRIVQYEWRWGDDPEADFRPGNITEEHAYTEAGTYTIELRVTDDEGRSSTMEHPVIVGGTFFGRLARVWGIREAFLQGALVTLELTAISVAGGFALAVFLALGRASRSRALSALATGYIEVIRGTRRCWQGAPRRRPRRSAAGCPR
ncbi:MAG TPA: PKD domain-containing protein, partial [Candidatus Thermoplasmatota archaeon]|nr:PKD domain-containing protein [Candidatus Thermoplasmatota archaeon]